MGDGRGMTGRSEVVARLEREANAAARVHAAQVAAFHHGERVGRMRVLLADVLERMEEDGEFERLAAQGITLERDAGGFRLSKGGQRAFGLSARGDYSVMVGDRVVYADPDCPVLDRRCYDEILSAIRAWARDGFRGR